MYFIWNLATCSCENGKYLVGIIDNSVITSNEIMDAELFQQILMKKSNL